MKYIERLPGSQWQAHRVLLSTSLTAYVIISLTNTAE